MKKRAKAYISVCRRSAGLGEEDRDYWLPLLRNLETIRDNDRRFSKKEYDKDHDMYGTPEDLVFWSGVGGGGSLEHTVDIILEFWNKPKASYSVGLEKKYESDRGFFRPKPTELRIIRTETFGPSDVLEHVLYIVRLREDSFFSWKRRVG